jgi:hypothetical protein
MRPPLCICGKALMRDKRGRPRATCGAYACFIAISANVGLRPVARSLPWPKVEGEIVADFRSHNVNTSDFGKATPKPAWERWI